jgi:hypothetical protein
MMRNAFAREIQDLFHDFYTPFTDTPSARGNDSSSIAEIEIKDGKDKFSKVFLPSTPSPHF